jgi:hypothetical protein
MKALIVTLIVIQVILIIYGAFRIFTDIPTGLSLILLNAGFLMLNIQNLDRL